MWAEDHRGEYTWEDARDQGGIIMDVLDMNYPIRYLMYVANQYADFFPSDGDDDDIAHGDRLYSTSYTKSGKTDHYPILTEIFSNLPAQSPTSINLRTHGDNLLPFAIRVTASLMLKFAIETGQYTLPTPLLVTLSGPSVLSAGGSMAASESSEIEKGGIIIINASAPSATGTWTANASGGDGPYTYQWYNLSSAGTTWYSIYGATSKTLTQTIYDSETFKCEVTSGNETAYDTHYVKFIGGGGGSLLLGNYPNPFNPTTKIRISLPSRQKVMLGIYNILRKQVITLHNGFLEEGYHEIEWNGRNQLGNPVSSGVYIYSLQIQDKIYNKKMFLAK